MLQNYLSPAFSYRSPYYENDYSVCVKDGRVHMRPLEEREVMDYRKSAQEVLDNVGGADNVVSAAHCATRLRLVIADNSKVNKEAIENVDGAKGVFEAQGQLQIIFGTGTVNKVYEEFIALSGVEAATKAEVKEAAAQQQNIFMRAIKVLGDVFVPIIPAIVASGLLLGIMSALNFMASNGFIALDTNNFIRSPTWSRARPLAFCRS